MSTALAQPSRRRRLVFLVASACLWVASCTGEVVGTVEDGTDEPPVTTAPDDDSGARPSDAGPAGPKSHSDGSAPGVYDARVLEPDAQPPEARDAEVGQDAAPSAATDAGVPPSNALNMGIRWLGRTDHANSNAARFSWSGSGLIATVSGSTIAVKLRTENTATVYFDPVIDGKPGARFSVQQGADRTVTLATGLSSGNHDVELYRDTEGAFGVSTFLGFTQGMLQGSKPSNGRLIEIIGDSISAGYGDLGSESHSGTQTSCTMSVDNSSWWSTYGAIAGRKLNAEVSSVARSGFGIIRDSGGNTANTMPSIYESLFGSGGTPKWSFETKPNFVLINLGTNDWQTGDPGTPFETAYVTFLKTIRGHYPDAWIALAIGPMFEKARLDQVKARLANVVSARSAAGDAKVFTFDFGSQDTAVTGCSWHPSASEHQIMATTLEQQVANKLGW